MHELGGLLLLVPGGLSVWVGLEWLMAKIVESRPMAPIAGVDLALAKRNLAEVQRALSAINYSDVWKHVGKLIKCGTVTVHAHKPTHGRRRVRLKFNVAEENDPSSGKTVADVTVDDNLRQYINENDQAMNQWIAQVVKGAFVKSLNTGLAFKVDDEATS